MHARQPHRITTATYAHSPSILKIVAHPWMLVALYLAAVVPSSSAQATRLTPAVAVAGSGPETYVLLTGMVGGVAGFRRVADRLISHGHRVVTIDPYHLSLDSADVTFSALARRVDRILAELDVVSAPVVGHAHGGGVALRLAANAPSRVKTVYLLDVGTQASHTGPVFSSSLRLVPLITRLPGGRRFVRERFLRGLLQNSGSHDWLDDSTRRAYTEPLLDSISRVVAMAKRLSRAREPETLGKMLARITVPVIVLLGDVPRPSEPEAAEMAGLELLRAPVRIERLPGVGHFPHEESPDVVVRHLLGDRAMVAARPSGVEP